MLQIKFLGTPLLTNENKPLVELTQAPAVLHLFAFLITHRQQPQQRSRLAGMFWPDVSEEQARRNLTNLFWRLRKMLPNADQLLRSDKESLQCIALERVLNQTGLTQDASAVSNAVWLDTVAFDQATQKLARLSVTRKGDEESEKGGGSKRENEQESERLAILSQYEEALALYRGDFLTDIELSLEHPWWEVERTKWRERYLHTLESFVDHCQFLQQPKRALSAAQQLVRLEPYQEGFQQRLIELYFALERLNEARKQFEQCEQLWRGDLGLSLSAKLQALAIRIGLRQSTALATEEKKSPLPPPIPLPLNQDEQRRVLQDHPAYLRRQLEICYKNDDLYKLMADRQSQAQNLQLAQRLADQLQESAAQIQVLIRRTWLAIHQGDYTEALTLAQRALQGCDQSQQQSKQDDKRAEVHRLFGIICDQQGNFSGALHHYNRALQVDEAHQVADMPLNLNNVAAIQLTLGQYYPAIHSLARVQQLMANKQSTESSSKQASGNTSGNTSGNASENTVVVIGNLGYAWLKLGQLEQAEAHLQQALTLVQHIGDRNLEWWLGALIARMYHLRGESTRGITLALHHYSMAYSAGDAWELAFLADTLALLYGRIQAGQESLQWAQWMQQHAHQKEQRRYQMRAWMRLAQAHCLLGGATEAFDCSSQAVQHYTRSYQTIEEEAELFATHAHCAQTIGHHALASDAQQRADQALHAQVEVIPEPMRQHFLQIQWWRRADSIRERA